MKKIDFSHPGGLPLTQDRLDFLQQSYLETIDVLSQVGVNGIEPIGVNGMEVTIPTAGTTNVTPGWFYYNGEMIYFLGGTVTYSGGDVPLVAISDSSTDLTYNDGSVFTALHEKVGSLTTGPSTTDPTHFPLSSLQSFYTGFGINGRETSWNTLGVSTPASQGNVTGIIYYKKNLITNTLQISGNLTVNMAQNLASSPGAIFYLMGTLPSGYLPANQVYFTSYYYSANLFKDDLGVAWIKQFTSVLNPSGQIVVNFIKPDISISAYSVCFNTILPLD